MDGERPSHSRTFVPRLHDTTHSSSLTPLSMLFAGLRYGIMPLGEAIGIKLPRHLSHASILLVRSRSALPATLPRVTVSTRAPQSSTEQHQGSIGVALGQHHISRALGQEHDIRASSGLHQGSIGAASGQHREHRGSTAASWTAPRRHRSASGALGPSAACACQIALHPRYHSRPKTGQVSQVLLSRDGLTVRPLIRSCLPYIPHRPCKPCQSSRSPCKAHIPSQARTPFEPDEYMARLRKSTRPELNNNPSPNQ